ncbi:MAG TPA: hypothetical protein VLE27_12505 [Thermoanaerobaculia bacterium]|jgi:hypothetical protein|nr:hypothetical protein [Thermoanaerobaculia bacterium]
MRTYKVEAKIDDDGGLRLSELPFEAGQEVEVLIVSLEPEPVEHLEDDEATKALRETLPPITRRLLGAARGAKEEDYYRYLEEKYR